MVDEIKANHEDDIADTRANTIHQIHNIALSRTLHLHATT
jgi:hypothetical protein